MKVLLKLEGGFRRQLFGAGNSTAGLLPAIGRFRRVRLEEGRGVCFLLAPVTVGMVITELVKGLATTMRSLGEGPVLVIDFYWKQSGTDFKTLDWSEPEDLSQPFEFDALDQDVTYVRVKVSDQLPDPERVANLITNTRRHFRSVLINGGAPHADFVTLTASPHCDGVVLVAGRSLSTRSELRSAHAVLSGGRAPILGFLFDETPFLEQEEA
jgi:hypothetical protein